MINKAYKYRIYPNKKQQEQFAKQFGCSRFVFNYFLKRRVDAYAENGKSLSFFDLIPELTALKKQPETLWLKEVNSQALQVSLKNLDIAYNNFFNRRSKFPSFKKKSNTQSFQVPQHFSINENAIGNKKLTIPKMAPIKLVLHREMEGKAKSITISRNPAGQYFASVLCEVADPNPEFIGNEIGIDLGLTSFLITSNSEKVNPGNHYRKAEKKLAKLQRRLAKKKKGSKNKEKTRIKVARHHQKTANQRADFLNRLSYRLVHENQMIHREDLAVKNMVKNHHLAKSISDAGWGEFTRQLDYKGKWYGCYSNVIDRWFPSSKRCNKCGFILGKLSLKIRNWTCPDCGAVHDRDINASINILVFGRAGVARSSASAQKACGDNVSLINLLVVEQLSLKQEASSFRAE